MRLPPPPNIRDFFNLHEGASHPEAVAPPVGVLDLGHGGAKPRQLRRDEWAATTWQASITGAMLDAATFSQRESS